MVFSIARKELKSMFASPMGWIILAVMQFVIGSYYTLSFNQYFEIITHQGMLPDRMGMTQFICEGVFGVSAILLVFTVPLISMRLISDEHKGKTMAFLMSAPISVTEIVLGKFIGLVAYLSLLLVAIVAMVSLLAIWTDIDTGYLLTNALGLWLLMLSAGAIGLLCSSLTNEAVIAGGLSFLVLVTFALLDKFLTENSSAFFHHFSLMQHYQHFTQGVFSTHDMLYFLLLTLACVLLTIRQLLTLHWW